MGLPGLISTLLELHNSVNLPGVESNLQSSGAWLLNLPLRFDDFFSEANNNIIKMKLDGEDDFREYCQEMNSSILLRSALENMDCFKHSSM
jgi:hypothetical protein